MCQWDAGQGGEVVNDPNNDSTSKRYYGLIMKIVQIYIIVAKGEIFKERDADQVNRNIQERRNYFLTDRIKWLSLGNGMRIRFKDTVDLQTGVRRMLWAKAWKGEECCPTVFSAVMEMFYSLHCST